MRFFALVFCVGILTLGVLGIFTNQTPAYGASNLPLGVKAAPTIELTPTLTRLAVCGVAVGWDVGFVCFGNDRVETGRACVDGDGAGDGEASRDLVWRSSRPISGQSHYRREARDAVCQRGLWRDGGVSGRREDRRMDLRPDGQGYECGPWLVDAGSAG